MRDFLDWAERAENTIVRQLGAQYVTGDLSEDRVVWTYGKNEATATPDDDGVTVSITFAIRDDEHRKMSDAAMGRAMIAGWLLGKH
jgi:hypothetical protein